MSNLEVFCIVAAGGTIGGLIAWLSWSLGVDAGTRRAGEGKTAALLQDAATPPDNLIEGLFCPPDRPRYAASSDCNDWRLNTVAPKPIPDCNCGGLCPGCAGEKKSASTTEQNPHDSLRSN